MMDQKNWITILVFLVIIIIAVLAYMFYIRGKTNKDEEKPTVPLTSSPFIAGLSAGGTGRSFENLKEGAKMVEPWLLKNTIMSLEDLKENCGSPNYQRFLQESFLPNLLPDIEKCVKKEPLDVNDFEMYGQGINNNISSITPSRIDYHNQQPIVYFSVQDGNFVKIVAYNYLTNTMNALYYSGLISVIHTPNMPSLIQNGNNYQIRRKINSMLLSRFKIWQAYYPNPILERFEIFGENIPNPVFVTNVENNTGQWNSTVTFKSGSEIMLTYDINTNQVKANYNWYLRLNRAFIDVNEFEMYGPGINNNTSGITPRRIDYHNQQPIVYFSAQDGSLVKVVAYNYLTNEMNGFHYSGSLPSFNTQNTPPNMALLTQTKTYFIKKKSLIVNNFFEKSFYPNCIREGLFYIKLANNQAFDNMYICTNQIAQDIKNKISNTQTTHVFDNINNYFIMVGDLTNSRKGRIPVSKIKIDKQQNKILFYAVDGPWIKLAEYNLTNGSKIASKYYGGNINTFESASYYTQGDIFSYNIETSAGDVIQNILIEPDNYDQFIIQNSDLNLARLNFQKDSLTTIFPVNNYPMPFLLIFKNRHLYNSSTSFYIKDIRGERDNQRDIVLGYQNSFIVHNGRYFMFELDEFRPPYFKNGFFAQSQNWKLGDQNTEYREFDTILQDDGSWLIQETKSGKYFYNNGDNFLSGRDRPGVFDDRFKWYLDFYEYPDYKGQGYRIRSKFDNKGITNTGVWDKLGLSNTGRVYHFARIGESLFTEHRVNVVIRGHDNYHKMTPKYVDSFQKSTTDQDFCKNSTSFNSFTFVPSGNGFKIKSDVVDKYLTLSNRYGTLVPDFSADINSALIFELKPVLSTEIADRYLRASVEYMKSNWIGNDSRQTNLQCFCGDNIRFPDGTLKIDIGDSTKISADKVTAAFERICACNMNTSIVPSYYTRLLCSDKFIKDNYGVNNSTDGQLYDKLRSTLNCDKPNCTFQKCRNLYENENKSQLDYTFYRTEESSRLATCGTNTLCIINQTLNNNGAMEGNTFIQNAENKCGQVGTDGVFPDENNDLSWLPNNTPTQ